MSDSDIVAMIVAGDPAGLAAAYDKYASDLYGYCRSLLRDQNDAADAVQDTYVIAASKLDRLREPERLRSWLFAVARNECLHRLKSRRTAAPLADAPEPADDSVDVGGEAERAETVALVRAAVGGLNDGERDVINQLWHGLDVPEVAAVLGVSRNHAHALFSRAREQLEASVGVLLVGRAGRADCATLDDLLGDWDGRVTVLLRKRVGRHIDRCKVCSDRRRRELTPALLYGVSPGGLLALAALRHVSALAAGQPGGPLSMVRAAVLHLTADPVSHATAFSAAAGNGAHSFGGNGFPKPPHHGYLGIAPPHLPVAVTGGTAVATVAVAAVVAVVPHQPPATRPPSGGVTLGVPVPSQVPAPGTGSGPACRDVAPTGPSCGTASVQAPRSHAAGGSAGGSTAPGGTASGLRTQSSAPATVTTISSSGTPATTVPPSAVALSLSTTTVLLSPLLGGTLTLTASGGPVSWSISEPVSLVGELSVNPASGALGAGQSVTVTISVTSLLSLNTQLTVQPGGQHVTVLLGNG